MGIKMKLSVLFTTAVLAASVLLTSCGGDGAEKSSLTGDGVSTAGESSVQTTETAKTAEDENTVPVQTEEVVKVTPTFMFFTSKNDADHDKTMAVVEELKKTYGEKIKFDLVDIDETPEATENFPVKDQTPALIMLNTSNDISAFEFKITDKSKMEEAIKTALGE